MEQSRVGVTADAIFAHLLLRALVYRNQRTTWLLYLYIF